jgi:hypothetical protein
MSPIYAAALILNPKHCTRYIQANWKREWREPALKSVQKLWETYREVKILVPTTTPFSYDKHNREEPKELDSFSCIALTLDIQARPASQDEYEDYNMVELYDPGTKGALAWWYQDT